MSSTFKETSHCSLHFGVNYMKYWLSVMKISQGGWFFTSWELESEKCSVQCHSLLHVICCYFYRSWWVNGKTWRDRHSHRSPRASARNPRCLYYVGKWHTHSATGGTYNTYKIVYSHHTAAVQSSLFTQGHKVKQIR